MPIEAALRGAALALLALLATLGLREWRTGPTARYGALLSLSAAAYAVESAPYPSTPTRGLDDTRTGRSAAVMEALD